MAHVEHVIRRMEERGDWIAWQNFVLYLRRNEDEEIVLNNGTTYTLRPAVIEAWKLFPFDITFSDVLATVLHSDEVINITAHDLTRYDLTRKVLLVSCLNALKTSDDLEYNGIEAYTSLGLSMGPDEFVTLDKPRQIQTRTRNELFREGVQRMGNTSYPMFAHLAVSMGPEETLEMNDGAQYNRLDLCDWLYNYENDNGSPHVHTMIALALFTPDQHFSINLLHYALNSNGVHIETNFKDAFSTYFRREPSGIDYNMLSIGGEDERRALILALRGNDLRAFAESALQRREEEQMRGKFDNDGEPNRKRRRDSPAMFL